MTVGFNIARFKVNFLSYVVTLPRVQHTTSPGAQVQMKIR